jgi:hypothetical protein
MHACMYAHYIFITLYMFMYVRMYVYTYVFRRTEQGVTGHPKDRPVIHHTGPTGRGITPFGLVHRLFLPVVMTFSL